MNPTENNPDVSLAEATELLNRTVAWIEEWLEVKTNTTASIPFDIGSASVAAVHSLRFGKRNGIWRLLFQTAASDSAPLIEQPISELSRRIRVLALRAIPELYAALESESRCHLEEILGAVADVKQFVKENS